MSSALSTIEKEWEPKFLAALAETGVVSKAVRAAGVDRSTPYRKREVDAEFARAWEVAMDEAMDELEWVARERATSVSDTLLIFLLKANRPAKYRENSRGESSGLVTINVTQLAEILATLGYRSGPDSQRVIEIEPSRVCSNGQSGPVANGHASQATEQESNGSDPGHRAKEEPEAPDYDAPPSWQE